MYKYDSSSLKKVFFHAHSLCRQAQLQTKVVKYRIAGVDIMQAEKDHSGRDDSLFTPHRFHLHPQNLSSYRPHHPRCRYQRPCSRPYPLVRRHPRRHRPEAMWSWSTKLECEILAEAWRKNISFLTSAFSSSAFLILAASSSSSVAVTTYDRKAQS